jgi:uncharacterized membrane protein YfcA
VNHVLLLAFAGFLAGAMNAMVGGGSFASFPALVAIGIPPVVANASSAVALYPGGLISSWVFRRGAGPVGAVPLRLLAAVTAAGGLIGALLLLETPGATFDRIVPWLLLVATLALAFGRRLTLAEGDGGSGRWSLLCGQLVLGAYGGYFGGAAGIMMVAFWTLACGVDAKGVQAQRTLLVVAANSAAILFFSLTAMVDWSAVLVVAPAALAGGYFGALAGLRLRARDVRVLTVAIAAGVTLLFFLRAYA